MKYASRIRNTALIATFALAVAAPSLGLAQGLPWKSSSSSSQGNYQSDVPPPVLHHYGTAQTTSSHHHYRASSPSTRDRAADDRRLNVLATKFYNISAKDPKAIERLKGLQGQVQEFREELDASTEDDILSDAKKLSWRISAQRKKLEAAADGSSGAPSADSSAGTPPVPHTSPMMPAQSPSPSAPTGTR